MIVSAGHRLTTNPIVCLRNRTAASPHVSTGGLWKSPRIDDQILPSRAPIARANDFFHSIIANSTTLPARNTSPISAGTSSVFVARPMIASSATAMIGRPSFKNVFQMPVVEASRATSEPVNPHEWNIPYMRPVATTPAPGTRFETVVEV